MKSFAERHDADFQRHGGVPKEDDLIKGLAEAFRAPEAAAIAWLAAIHTRFDAKAAHERLAARQGASE